MDVCVTDIERIDEATGATMWPFSKPTYIVMGRRLVTPDDRRVHKSVSVRVGGFRHYSWLLPPALLVPTDNSLACLAGEIETFLREKLRRQFNGHNLKCVHLDRYLDSGGSAEAEAAMKAAGSMTAPTAEERREHGLQSNVEMQEEMERNEECTDEPEWVPCWACFGRNRLGMHVSGPRKKADLQALRDTEYARCNVAEAIRVEAMPRYALPSQGFRRRPAHMLRVWLATPELARWVAAQINKIPREAGRKFNAGRGDDGDDDVVGDVGEHDLRWGSTPEDIFMEDVRVCDEPVRKRARRNQKFEPKSFEQKYPMLKRAADNWAHAPVTTMETPVTGTMRFMVDTGVTSAKWLRLSTEEDGDAEDGADRVTAVVDAGRRLTRCDEEWETVKGGSVRGHNEPVGRKDVPMRVLSFDIETVNREREDGGAAPGGLPHAERAGRVIQIASVVWDMVPGAGEHDEVAVSLLALDTMDVDEMRRRWPQCRVQTFEDSDEGERQLLEAWRQLVLETDPDVVTDYNGEGYDIPFLWKRAARLGVSASFEDVSRLVGWTSALENFSFQSAARGLRVVERVRMPGRAHMDMMLAVKENKRLASYSLASVCSAVFADQKQKEDVPAALITQLWRKGDRMRASIGSYCVKDAELPLQIMKTCSYLGLYCALSKLCGVTLESLFVRGQGFKGYMQMLAYARKNGYVVSDVPRSGGGTKTTYVGAWVHPCVDSLGNSTRGLHLLILAMLDFASLYPSEILRFNIGPDTYMPPYVSLDGLGLTEADVHVSPKGHRFVKKHVRVSVLSKLIGQLLDARAATKGALKEAVDELTRGNLDAEQLALKISANSMYGLFGAETSKLYLKAVAESITAWGQVHIQETYKLCEHLVGSKHTADVLCVYGDSVSSDTPLLLCQKTADGRPGAMVIRTVSELWALGTPVAGDGLREYSDVTAAGWMTYTERRWTPVQRVMRHRTGKPMFRVSTPSGVVDVTADHSLVRANGEKVCPRNINVGDDLLHAFPVWLDFKDGVGPLFALNTEYATDTDDFSPKDAYALGKRLARDGGALPDGILNMSCDHRANLFRGFFVEGCDQNDLNCLKIGDKKLALGIYAIVRSLQKQCRIVCPRYSTHVCLVIGGADYAYDPYDPYVADVTDMHKVQDVEPLPHNGDYVYDLTTENHHFHAGIGQMIVHNTDSVMLKIQNERFGGDARTAWAVGIFCEHVANRHFNETAKAEGAAPKRLRLEFEAMYGPFLLISKKRYAACAYEVFHEAVDALAKKFAAEFGRPGQTVAQAAAELHAVRDQPDHPLIVQMRTILDTLAAAAVAPGDDPDQPHPWSLGPLPTPTKIKSMGIESKRRDNCALMRRTLDAVLRKLMIERDPDAAFEVARQAAEDVVQQALPWEDFIISKSMSKLLKDYDAVRQDSSPHLRVVQLMQERDPTTAPAAGERVPFIMVKKSLERWKQSRRAAASGVATTEERILARLRESNGDVSVLPVAERRRVVAMDPSRLMRPPRRTDVRDARGNVLRVMPPRAGATRSATAETRNASAADSAEDPAYALINDMQIDADYYLYKQLMKPILRVLVPVEEPAAMREKMGDRAWRETRSFRRIFEGKHMRVHKMRKSNTWGAMAKFVRPQAPCVMCGAPSAKGEGPPVCDTCWRTDDNELVGLRARALDVLRRRYEAARDRYEAVMETCRHCLRATLEDPDLCFQRTCMVDVRGAGAVPTMFVERAQEQGRTTATWPMSGGGGGVVDIEDLGKWMESEPVMGKRNMFYERIKRRDEMQRAERVWRESGGK